MISITIKSYTTKSFGINIGLLTYRGITIIPSYCPAIGIDTGIWVPSIAPKHWGTPHFALNSLTTLSILLPVGNLMYVFNKMVTIAEHVSWTISHTEDQDTSNRCPTVQYSAGVAKHCNVIATRFCTEMHSLITVSCFCSLEDNLSHKYKKVCLLIQKLLSQSWSVKLLNTMLSHHVLDLYELKYLTIITDT